MDPYKALGLIPKPDGSLTRNPLFPNLPPASYDTSTESQSVASIDVPLNTDKNTWIRIFLPSNLPSNNSKLPIIIYFHGGGFIVFSAASLPYHEFCVRLASELPAVILSVEYQLAPESRLPSAYEDAIDAINWLKKQALNGGEHKFVDFVEFTGCFLMGSSSGGNIAYQAGLRVADLDIEPVKINGLILNQPFFGGVERTGSELRYANDEILPLPVSDLMWEFALPIGANRNHEYCNPMVEKSHYCKIRMLPRCLINGNGRDPLVDHQKEFVKMLERNGVCVVAHFADDGSHAVELFDPEMARALVTNVRKFIYSSATDVGVSTTGAAKSSIPIDRLLFCK